MNRRLATRCNKTTREITRETCIQNEISGHMRKVWFCASRGGSFAHGTAATASAAAGGVAAAAGVAPTALECHIRQPCVDADIYCLWAQNTRMLASTRTEAAPSQPSRSIALPNDGPLLPCEVRDPLLKVLGTPSLASVADDITSVDFVVNHLDVAFRRFFESFNVNALDPIVFPSVVYNTSVCTPVQWRALHAHVLPRLLFRHETVDFLTRSLRAMGDHSKDDAGTSELREAVRQHGDTAMDDAQRGRQLRIMKAFCIGVHQSLRAMYLEKLRLQCIASRDPFPPEVRRRLSPGCGAESTTAGAAVTMDALQRQFHWDTLIDECSTAFSPDGSALVPMIPPSLSEELKLLLRVRRERDVARWILEYPVERRKTISAEMTAAHRAVLSRDDSWAAVTVPLCLVRNEFDDWLFDFASSF